MLPAGKRNSGKKRPKPRRSIGSYTSPISSKEQYLPKSTITKAIRKLSPDYQPKIHALLRSLPHIPLGQNIGDQKWHECDENSRRHFKETGDTLYVGYLVIADRPDISRHTFNVRDGKVYEVTGGIELTPESYYVGVPVLKKDMPAYRYVNHLDNPKWVEEQKKRMMWSP